MSQNELLTKIKQAQELKRMREELDAELESLQDAIKAEMKERNTTEMVVDCFKVRWTDVTQNKLDTASLKRELPEVAERYTKQTTYKRFSIN